MISIGIYVGGSIYFGPMGAGYSLPPKIVFSSDMNISFELLKRLIYQRLGLLEKQCTLNIQAKMNLGDQGSMYFSLVPIFDDQRLSAVIEQTIRCPYLSMLELFVEIIPHISSNAYVPTSDDLPGSSSQPNWNAPPDPSHNIPQYQQQVINPYYQSNWNVPQYPPEGIPQHQSEPINPYYVGEPQYNIPEENIPQSGENDANDPRNGADEAEIRVQSIPSKDDDFFNCYTEPPDDTEAEEEGG